MDRNVPSTFIAFSSLPIELNKAIADCLDTDRDVANFQSICRATRDAVLGDGLSFWRVKFRETYAYKEGISNKELKKKYQRRRQVLRVGTGRSFYEGNSKEELKVITVLKELINESFQGPAVEDDYGRPHCPNLDHLSRFVVNSKLFSAKRRPTSLPLDSPQEANSDLAAIRLMCSHFLFDANETRPVYGVDESQQAVYAPTNAEPIFKEHGKVVNMGWILQCLNFFRNYMTNKEMGTMFDKISGLPVSERPSAWQVPLEEGSHSLSRNWKGTFAFLDNADLRRLRQKRQKKDFVAMDLNIDEGKVQNFELDFMQPGKLPWPRLFEDRLQSHRYPPPQRTTRAQTSSKSKSRDISLHSIQLVGSGSDEEDDFFASGWLNALQPQCGILGWQRITFMKHFIDDENQVNDDDLWAYEGVVLPGGRLILGRWWSATEEPDFNNDNCGPFILWACDDDPELDHIEEDSGEGDETDGVAGAKTKAKVKAK